MENYLIFIPPPTGILGVAGGAEEMKGFQFCKVLLTLALLFIGLSGLTYFLGTLSLRLALIIEFTLLALMLVISFILFDRALNRTG